MKNKSYVILSVSAAVLLTAVALYFLNSTAGVDPSLAAGSPNASQTAGDDAGRLKPRDMAAIKQENTAKSLLVPMSEEEKEAKYSSNPPQSKEQKEILTLVSRLDMTDMEKAMALLNRFHSLPAAEKVLALEQATQLIPDDKYVELRPTLFQMASNEELRETVMTDVLNRGDKVRMPTLVEMLRQPPNPAQEEVREILLAYLEEDPGPDLAKWDAAVKKFLVETAETPEE